MRDGDAGRRGRRERRAHAGHDFERHAGAGQRQRLLAAAPEHERIAALEPHDALPGAPEPHQQLLDLALARSAGAHRLAHVELRRGLGRERQDFGADQPIVDDGIRRLQSSQRLERQQLRVARPRADQ